MCKCEPLSEYQRSVIDRGPTLFHQTSPIVYMLINCVKKPIILSTSNDWALMRGPARRDVTVLSDLIKITCKQNVE